MPPSNYDELYDWIDTFIPKPEVDQHGCLADVHVDGNLPYFFESFFEDHAAKILEPVNTSASFKLKFNLDDARGIQMIGKKALFLADYTVLEIAEDPSHLVSGLHDRSDPRDYRDVTAEEQEELDNEPLPFGIVARRLIGALITLRPMIETGKLVVLPHAGFSFEVSDRQRRETFTPEPLRLHLEVNAHHAELQTQLLEHLSPAAMTSSSAIEVRLPHLRNVSPEDLIAFREHNAVEFETFYRELEKLMRELSSRAMTGEAALLEIMRGIEHEVKKLDSMYQREKRKSLALTAAEVTLLAGGLVAHGALPEPLAQMIITILGAATLKDVLTTLASPKVPYDSPFYVAWKLHKDFGS